MFCPKGLYIKAHQKSFHFVSTQEEVEELETLYKQRQISVLMGIKILQRITTVRYEKFFEQESTSL